VAVEVVDVVAVVEVADVVMGSAGVVVVWE